METVGSVYNPYIAKLKKAEERLANLEKRQRHYDAIAIPGTLVTGRSGISASYKKRLDRQVEKTIDLAGLLIEQRRKVATLRQSVQMYDNGKINAQGRSVRPTRQVVRRIDKSLKQLLEAEMRQTYFHMEIDGFATFRGHKLEVLINPLWNDKSAAPRGVIRQTLPDGTTLDHIAPSIQGVHLGATAYALMRQIDKDSLLTNG